MMTITSAAGRRLAKAKYERDVAIIESGGKANLDTELAKLEFLKAAIEVGNELVAQGFHNTESKD